MENKYMVNSSCVGKWVNSESIETCRVLSVMKSHYGRLNGWPKVALRFNRIGACRLEEAVDYQLSLAVNVGVRHILFVRESIGSLQRLDPEWTNTPYSVFKGQIKGFIKGFLKDNNYTFLCHQGFFSFGLYWPAEVLSSILPYKVLDKFQLAVDCWCVFMNHWYMALNAKREHSWSNYSRQRENWNI